MKQYTIYHPQSKNFLKQLANKRWKFSDKQEVVLFTKEFIRMVKDTEFLVFENTDIIPTKDLEYQEYTGTEFLIEPSAN